MSQRGCPRSLASTLTINLVVVAGVFSALLLAFFFAKYMLDTPALRQGALATEVKAIAAALARHQDPANRWLYRDYPRSYGFRLFDIHPGEPLRRIAEANPQLLPAIAGAGNGPFDLTPSLAAGFEQTEAAAGGPGRDRWLLTEHLKISGRAYLVQVAMAGDPARLWQEAIADEMVDHVILPVLFIVPALTVAVVLITRRGLRPLARIVLQAAALGAAVRSGDPLTPLSQDRLPFEFDRLVGAINAMLASLKHALEDQRQFTSDVAHELRTPLSVMLLELAELEPGPVVEQLKQEIQSLAVLVNQLLGLAQAENMMQRQRESVDLIAVARRVCEDLAGVALSQHVMVDLNGPPGPLLVRGNAALLDVAIRNLIDNAIKWSAPGTAVTVTVRDDGNAVAEVLVEDRGPGVPDAQKPRIFERFWRGDRDRGRNGSGIGLALVRRIAELHGGNVRVEDREGGGARFVLSLQGSRVGCVELEHSRRWAAARIRRRVRSGVRLSV